MTATGVDRKAPQLSKLDLHHSLSSPTSDAMNFLNEIALRHPDAISFAAGRPFEGFFDTTSVHRYVERFESYLRMDLGYDESLVRRTGGPKASYTISSSGISPSTRASRWTRNPSS